MAKPCRKCGSCEEVESIQTFKDGGKHIRVNCAQCGKYIRYNPRWEPLDQELRAIVGPKDVYHEDALKFL